MCVWGVLAVRRGHSRWQSRDFATGQSLGHGSSLLRPAFGSWSGASKRGAGVPFGRAMLGETDIRSILLVCNGRWPCPCQAGLAPSPLAGQGGWSGGGGRLSEPLSPQALANSMLEYESLETEVSALHDDLWEQLNLDNQVSKCGDSGPCAGASRGPSPVRWGRGS